MGPRLAPLALLLLALCGYAAGLSWSLKTVNSQSTTSSIVTSRTSKDKKDAVAQKTSEEVAKIKSGESDAAKIEKLLALTGNSILALVFSVTGAMKDMHLNIQKAFANGVMCEVTDELNDKIKGISSTPNADELTAHKIDCSKVPTAADDKASHKCMCIDGKKFLYCFLAAFKANIEEEYRKQGVVKGPCRDVAVPALESAGTTELGKAFSIEASLSNKFEDEFNGKVTEKTDEATAKLFCDATDQKVEDAVKAVYAADALYWITETVLYTILFGEVNIDEACKNSEYKSSTLGKCVCAVETGFTFCMLKALGTFYKKEGYLTCEDSAKTGAFVTGKKPDGVPQTVLPKAKSSATTAFSLLVPTFAAATLLLRH